MFLTLITAVTGAAVQIFLYALLGIAGIFRLLKNRISRRSGVRGNDRNAV